MTESRISRCVLRGFSASVVNKRAIATDHGNTENTEVAQRIRMMSPRESEGE